MTHSDFINDPESLLAEVRQIRNAVAEHGAETLERWRPRIKRGEWLPGAENLAHYLALRHIDLRPMQTSMLPLGLSSLGRIEGHVMPTLQAIIANLELICRANAETPRPGPDAFTRGSEALERNTRDALGSVAEGRRTAIMVTLSERAAEDPDHVRAMVDAGMDCARVNCAHNGPDEWRAMIANVRSAAASAGRSSRVLMDLAGPKIRTLQVRTPSGRKRVKKGDTLLLAFGALSDEFDFKFQANCATPEVLRQVGLGASISIKDGLIQGVVSEVRPEGLVVSVERTPPDGQPLKAEKGINFPSTDLIVSPLSGDDLKALDFAAEHGDIISYSFVQRPEDIALLQSEITSRRKDRAAMPIVAKVETRLAFANLPELIVQAAGANPFAVMIARGDLAVEVGYERLSEIQEEIMWVCEAAHVPVIWATQVLESLVKQGMPSRGEFTDAAMAERAECVMLNKGRYIEEGIAVLDNVLRRMETHRRKRSAQLRSLKAWDRHI